LFPAEQIRHLAADAQQRLADGAFRRAAVGRGDERTVRGELRSDFVLWLDEATATPAERELLQAFEGLRLAVNRRLYLGLLTFEGHLAHYPPGACYGRHLDQFRGVESRILTLIVYLNEDWQEGDGGQLRLYLGQSTDSPYLDVPPAAGTLVSFLSGVFYHEVLPARRGRLSLTGWFRRRDGPRGS
jgi:SM-20-related protein